MRSRIRQLLALLLAGVSWSAMVAGASANRLSASSQHFRIVWASLNFGATAVSSTRVLCPLTLEGSFHSATIVKTRGSLVGFVTRASIKGEACTGGAMTVLSESLPWHLTYQGFNGELPRPTGVVLLLVRPAFEIHPTGSIACLANAEARHPWQAIAEVGAGGAISGLRPEQGHKIPLTGEGGVCATGGELFFREEEVGRFTNETGSAITITLI